MKTSLKTKILALSLCLWCVATAANAQTGDAQAILQKARTALGHQDTGKTIQSLAFSAVVQHYLPDTEKIEHESTFQASLLLPDKYLKITETTDPISSGKIKTVESLSGEQQWGNVVIGASQGKENQYANDSSYLVTGAGDLQSEFVRSAIVFLLTPPKNFPLTWKYKGIGDVSGHSVDILEATSPQGFSARFSFDQQTHWPLMVSYPLSEIVFGEAIIGESANVQDKPDGQSRPAIELISGTSGSATYTIQELSAGQLLPTNPTASAVISPAISPAISMVGRSTDIGREAAEQAPEIQMHLNDYRQIGGLYFPQEVHFTINGKRIDSWKNLSWTPNAELKAEDFLPKER